MASPFLSASKWGQHQLFFAKNKCFFQFNGYFWILNDFAAKRMAKNNVTFGQNEHNSTRQMTLLRHNGEMLVQQTLRELSVRAVGFTKFHA